MDSYNQKIELDIETLEVLADKSDLLLSDNLIQFALLVQERLLETGGVTENATGKVLD